MAKIVIPDGSEFPSTAEVVVIGGGILGAATAFYASRAGLQAVVLEMREGLASLTTAASEECFRAQFSEAENVEMMLASIQVYETFADLIGIPDYGISLRQQGYLFLSDSPDAPTKLQERVQHQQRIGLADVEYLSGDEVRRRFPWAGPAVTAATYRAKDGWLSAHEATYGFAKGSAAQFLLRTKALGLRTDAHGVCAVETSRGVIETRQVVAAAGPFSGEVAQLAGLDLPLTAVRRQKVILAPDPLIPSDAPMTIDDVGGAYWRPEVGGAAIGWALPEEPGRPVEKVPTDWTFPALALEEVSRLAPFWSQVAERLTRANVFLSAGQYTMTPDSKPILGPCGVPGLFLNAGYSGHGIMAAPEGSRMVVEMMLGRLDAETSPFGLARFKGAQGRLQTERMVI
ncbi:MAG: FAD-binding oxidoreductase [Chloroflexi bacterium]|nr:FAD-binding oxidoreductase [Chloroflexota bacterium]